MARSGLAYATTARDTSRMANNAPSHPVLTISEARERGAVTVEQAAALLGIGRTTAYDAARTGELPALRLGRRIVVPVPALLRMLAVDDDQRADRYPPTVLHVQTTPRGSTVDSASRGRTRAEQR